MVIYELKLSFVSHFISMAGKKVRVDTPRFGLLNTCPCKAQPFPYSSLNIKSTPFCLVIHPSLMGLLMVVYPSLTCFCLSKYSTMDSLRCGRIKETNCPCIHGNGHHTKVWVYIFSDKICICFYKARQVRC
ncbi:MAG: hypothetical protein KatS3mg028_0522 [Bacteroidia bacterium]|nr:MAG: hypothetical protein KatS3mg028_0522 [Bacteroidia bacterium]